MVEPTGSVRGCSITALWLRLTPATVSHWRSMLCPLWMTPSPPSSAMVRAMAPPVTLSMFEDTMGSSRASAVVNCERSAMVARVAVMPFWGRNRKSSKVLPIQAGSRGCLFMGQKWVGTAGAAGHSDGLGTDDKTLAPRAQAPFRWRLGASRHRPRADR